MDDAFQFHRDHPENAWQASTRAMRDFQAELEELRRQQQQAQQQHQQGSQVSLTARDGCLLFHALVPQT